jgi:hypothetical protein
MYEMKCEDESNVRTHLEALMRMQEQLAGMDAGLTDDDLVTVILGSLPKGYRPLINAISLSATHAKVTLTPDVVVQSLLEEFERLKIEECQLKATESALAVGKGRGKGRHASNSNGGKSDIECWKCGKKGHIKADCNSKGKKKEKDGDKKKGSESANAVIEDSEWAFTTTVAGHILSRETSKFRGTEVDVYDSGASTHMSPNRHRFTSFKEIPPRRITAAERTVFTATGIGNMRIAIPNGKTTNHITLKDVLYCPDLAFTLISLVRCDKAGFAVLLRDQHCTIRDAKGTTVGKIPLKEELYKVEHNSLTESANIVQKTLSIDELHRRMGHISPHAIKNLLVKGIITGIEVDKKSVPMFCTSCAQGKMTRKPIPKERIGPRAVKLGEKVHSDVWGPTTPQSYDGREYFVSFTDDFTRWTRVEPMKKKSEVLTCYRQYEAWAETQHGAKIK